MAIMTGKVTFGYAQILVFLLQVFWPPIQSAPPIIQPDPSSLRLDAVVGQRVSLFCRLSQGGSQTTITWNKINGPQVGEGEELRFEAAQQNDEGFYTCNAENNEGTDSRAFTLDIHAAVQVGSFVGVPLTIKNTHDVQGLILTWYSQLATPTHSDDNNKVAFWNGPGTGRSLKSGYNVDKSNGDLLIQDVKFNMEGAFTAKLFHPARGEVYRYTYLHVHVAPSSVVMSGLDSPVVEDRSVTVTCTVSRVKPHNVTIIWSLTNGGQISDATTGHRENQDGSYTVWSRLQRRFKRRDNGDELKCQVMHGVDNRKSVSTSRPITVYHIYKVRSEEVDSTMLPVRGENKRVRCRDTDTGQPESTSITWYRDDQGPLTGQRYTGTDSRTLTINSLIDEDAGVYRCQVDNDAGPSTSLSTYNLQTVLYAPIISMPCPRPINESDSAEIRCTVDSEPPVDDNAIMWTFNGTLLPTRGTVHQLYDTSRMDRGWYTCQANNTIGSKSTRCNVIVNYGPTGDPRITSSSQSVDIDDELTLLCQTESLDQGYPRAMEYVWKKDGAVIQRGRYPEYRVVPGVVGDGGRYSCALSNEYGVSNYGHIDITVHAPITIENGELRSFTPDYNDEDFTVYYNVSGTRSMQFDVKNSSDVVSDVHFIEVSRRVEGEFSYGQRSAWSVGWRWVVRESYYNNCTSITFYNGDYSFTARETQGGASKTGVFRINVQYPPVWGSMSKVQSSALDVRKTLTCDVCASPGQLTYQWSYRGRDLSSTGHQLDIASVTSSHIGDYTCRATNQKGSREFLIKLEERGSPHPPANLTITSRTSRTLLVKWTVTFNGGFDLLKFQLRINDGTKETTEETTECLTGRECQYRVRNLQPETLYRIKVRAQNAWNEVARSYSHDTEVEGRTIATPYFRPLAPDVTSTYMMVSWLYEGHRNVRAAVTQTSDSHVSLVIFYRKDGQSDFLQFPDEGRVAAVDQRAKIDGDFDPSATYHVKYEVYEGEQLALDIEPEAVPGRVVSGVSNAGVIAGAAVGVILAILLVVVIAVIWLRRTKHRRPRSDMDKNSGLGYRPVPHSASSESIPIRPPMLKPTSTARQENHQMPPLPDGRPVVAHPLKRNGVKKDNPYENVPRPYENVGHQPGVNSSQTSLYDNAQYEDVEFSKNKDTGTNAHGDAPVPAKRRSKKRDPPLPEEDQPGLFYADLMFDDRGHRQPAVPPRLIHGDQERVDYASLDFEQMKSTAANSPDPPESLYKNVKQSDSEV